MSSSYIFRLTFKSIQPDISVAMSSSEVGCSLSRTSSALR